MKRVLTFLIFILLFGGCRPYYPLKFSLDGIKWDKSIEYEQKNNELFISGDFSPFSSFQHLQIVIEYSILENNSSFPDVEDVYINSNFDFESKVRIPPKAKSIYLSIYIYHKNIRTMSNDAIIKYMNDNFLIVKLSNIFEDTLSVHVKLDSSQIIRRFLRRKE